MKLPCGCNLADPAISLAWVGVFTYLCEAHRAVVRAERESATIAAKSLTREDLEEFNLPYSGVKRESAKYLRDRAVLLHMHEWECKLARDLLEQSSREGAFSRATPCAGA